MAQGQGASGRGVCHRRIHGTCRSAETSGRTSAGCLSRQRFHFCGQSWHRFFQQTLAALAKSFRPLIRGSAPFVEPPREKNVTWLEPRLVAQIAFQGSTADQKLRQPVFLGLRDDKEPSESVMPEKL